MAENAELAANRQVSPVLSVNNHCAVCFLIIPTVSANIDELQLCKYSGVQATKNSEKVEKTASQASGNALPGEYWLNMIVIFPGVINS